MKPYKIKVCGLKHPENIQDVDALGVDFIGLIFYDQSPRFVNINSIPTTNAQKVGVFVNASTSYIIDQINTYHLKAVQLHGNETISQVKELRQAILKQDKLGFIEVWKAISIRTKEDLNICKTYEHFIDKFVFDTKTNLYGGSGAKFDWSVLEAYQLSTNFILSGGISAEDDKTIKRLKHHKCVGLDLNSKFEITPGHKSISALQLFAKKIVSYENTYL
jgi:phosphoribosylanthranilate isomerase